MLYISNSNWVISGTQSIGKAASRPTSAVGFCQNLKIVKLFIPVYSEKPQFQTISIMWSTILMHLIKQNCIVFCAAHTLVSCFVFWMCVFVNMWVCVHCVAFSTFLVVRATVLPDTLSAPNIALKVRGHHQLLPKRPGVVKWKMESL